MRKSLLTTVLVLTAGLTLLRPAAAQNTSAPARAPAEPEILFRVYEVGDLMRPTQDYPLTPPPPERQTGTTEANGGKSIAAPARPTEYEKRMEVITSMIRESIGVGTWKEDGGLIGSLRSLPFGESIIVVQTEPMHKEIDKLLAELRKQRGIRTMLSVRASWVVLDPKAVDALYDTPAKSVEARQTDGAATVTAMPEATDALLAKGTLYCQAQTTCFNGQTVAIQSGREWSVVTGMTPVVGTQAVGFDAKVEQVRSGVTLQLTPQLAGDEDYLVLDLHSVVTESRQPAANPIRVSASTQPAGMDAAKMSDLTMATIDRTDVLRQAFATTARVPLGKRVLVAGMTLQPAVGDATPRHLYLLVRADAVR